MVGTYLECREVWRRCDSQSQAAAVVGRLRADAREGKLFPKAKAVKPVLLTDYFQTWLKTQPAKGKKEVTIRTYAWRLKKHVLPVFGRMPLSETTRPSIKAWATTLLDKLDFDTAMNTVLTLSAVLSEAVEDGVIPQNPALRAGKLLKRPNTLEESELGIFTPDEERAFLDTIQRERPLFYPMALTFFRTGLRAGEVMGLHREDLDFRTRTIHVRRN